LPSIGGLGTHAAEIFIQAAAVRVVIAPAAGGSFGGLGCGNWRFAESGRSESLSAAE
jgi:hypothetical protein